MCVILIQCSYFPRLCRYLGLRFGVNGVFSCENIFFSRTRLSIFALFSQVYLKKMPAYNLNKTRITELSLLPWGRYCLTGLSKGYFQFWLSCLFGCLLLCFIFVTFRCRLVWHCAQSIPGLDILDIRVAFPVQTDYPFFFFSIPAGFCSPHAKIIVWLIRSLNLFLYCRSFEKVPYMFRWGWCDAPALGNLKQKPLSLQRNSFFLSFSSPAHTGTHTILTDVLKTWWRLEWERWVQLANVSQFFGHKSKCF